MERRLKISPEPINVAALAATRKPSATSGAVVYFLGVVRDIENGTKLRAMEYEAHITMAEYQFHKLFDEMAQRWPLESVHLIHRVGEVMVGESSLWVEIVAPHRGEALDACGWIIDQMKKVVPIWKKPLPVGNLQGFCNLLTIGGESME